jgi:CRISPR-associated protein Csx17
LLRLLARNWPSVRIAWREDTLQIVAGPASIEAVLDELMSVAGKRSWTPYGRRWTEAQKKSTKAKSGAALALWQAFADEDVLELLVAHVVPTARLNFNPLLGTGGNAGKRDFSAGWEKAITSLASPVESKGAGKNRRKTPLGRRSTTPEDADQRPVELKALLLGTPTTWTLEKLNAASWFSDANKLYNSGQEPFREGRISPWAMALACEGLTFLAGGTSRRLGTRTRAVGAFPFVTRAAAPSVSGEAGRDLAEVWAPLWERPMTVPETRTLFARGRAEVAGRGALTPSAFATAITRRGVDAGIREFRRFILAHTTSKNTFEPRLEGTFPLSPVPPAPKAPSAIVVPRALECLLGLIDRLPKDQKIGQRWRFVGLRGPIEEAMLHLAASPDDPEVARGVLDAAVVALDRVDRNRRFREALVSWKPLPLQWLPSLFGSEQPVIEARLAMALASGFPVKRPLTLYRFGVVWEYGGFQHPARAPTRWIWGPAPLPSVLSAVLHRRMLDWESARDDEEPVRFVVPIPGADVSRWLEGTTDEVLLARWISRLAMFDWRFVPTAVSGLMPPTTGFPQANAALCLIGLFQPLFDSRPLRASSALSQRDLLDPKSGARTPGATRRLASLLRIGQIDAAVRLARSRYAMASARLAQTSAPWRVTNPERILASVLFPISDVDRTPLIERWLRPRRQRGDKDHA